MFQIFIILISLSIILGINVSLNEQCKCQIFQNESTCENNEQCNWDDTQCVEKTCKQFLSQSKCDKQPTCSWNVSKCTQFTSCQDYYVNDSYDCYLIGDDIQKLWCQPDVSGNKCSSFQYQQCGLIEEDCDGFSDYWNLCYWNSNTCLKVDVRICSSLVDQFLCSLFGVGLGCKWSNETCQPQQCEDFTSEENCVMIRPDNINQDPFLCAWNSEKNQCILAEDINHLDQTNCYTNTLNNYIWNTTLNQCIQCASISTTP